MTDLKLIEAFVLAMRHGSLSAAETHSGIPKATLSRLISRLEESLGVQLFQRSARRAVPTEAGRQFYVHSQRLLDSVNAEFEEAKAVVQNLADGNSGELSIVTVSCLSSSYVTHILSRYMELHPAVVCRLDIVCDPTPTRADNVDCYVSTAPPADPNLTTFLLGKLKCRLFASPAYVKKFGMPRAPSDLIHHKCLVLQRNLSDVTIRLTSYDQIVECEIPVGGSTNDYWIMKTMAIDGYGVAALPDFFARPEVEAGTLLPVLAEWEAPALPVYCAYPKRRLLGRKVSGLIDLMIESFEQIGVIHFYVADSAAVDHMAAL
jgi:DNA-binding transcriptional LysR family regulator